MFCNLKNNADICNVIENKTVTTGRQPVHRVGQQPTYIAKQKTGVAPVTSKGGRAMPYEKTQPAGRLQAL